MDDVAEPRDWLSRLLEMVPVSGTLDVRCFLGAPWRIDFAPSEAGEIAYHVVLGGQFARRTADRILEDRRAAERWIAG